MERSQTEGVRPHAPRERALTESCASHCREFEAAKDCQPDFHFRCSHCVALIGEDKPVYMHKDRSYCSSQCRHKGRSTLYIHLRELQLEQAADGRGWGSCQSSVADSRSDGRSLISSAQSDSTLSRGSRKRASTESSGIRGPFSWFLKRVFSAVVSRIPAPEMVRSASSVLRNRLSQDESFTRLGAFLPSAYSFMSNDQLSPEVSKTCSPSISDIQDRLSQDLSKNFSSQTMDAGSE